MSHKRKIFLAIGICLIALILRGPITVVGSLSGWMEEALNLSAAQMGVITTIPLVTFALFSPLIGSLSWPLHRTLGIGIGLIVAGAALRVAGTAGLYLGTVLVGLGIAVGNVLIPAVIKQAFPDRIGLMTGFHSVCMSVGAAIAAGTALPLANWNGWRFSLLVWLIPAVVAGLIWLPQRSTLEMTRQAETKKRHSPIWKSKLTWYVTLTMGLQSFLYYCFVAWLPSIGASRGLSDGACSTLAVIYQMMPIAVQLIIPTAADRMRDQRLLPVLCGLPYLVALIGLIFTRSLVGCILCVAVSALCQGAFLCLALTYFGLRTTTAEQAAQLSGMAQCVGYAIAAVGPVLTGALFDATASWTPMLLLEIAALIALIGAAAAAGRDEKIPM